MICLSGSTSSLSRSSFLKYSKFYSVSLIFHAPMISLCRAEVKCWVTFEEQVTTSKQSCIFTSDTTANRDGFLLYILRMLQLSQISVPFIPSSSSEIHPTPMNHYSEENILKYTSQQKTRDRILMRTGQTSYFQVADFDRFRKGQEVFSAAMNWWYSGMWWP